MTRFRPFAPVVTVWDPDGLRTFGPFARFTTMPGRWEWRRYKVWS